MDFSDTTVVIAVKDEPGVGSVVKSVFSTLKNCKVLVIYKGKLPVAPRSNLKILKQADSGKGRAIIEAIRHVATPIACFIDGDETYDAKDLVKVINLVRGGADLALGDRVSHLQREAMPRGIQFGNWALTFTANLFYGMHLRDSQTGLRAIKTKVIRSLNLSQPYFGIEEEINIMTRKRGYVIKETPIRYYERVGVAKHSKAFGGFKLLAVIFRLLFR